MSALVSSCLLRLRKKTERSRSEPWRQPNKALEPTAYSPRSCVAPAFGGGSLLAFSRTLRVRENVAAKS